MLAYFMTSPGSNHAITLPIEQPAQQRSQQQVLVRAQQLAAAASSSQQLLLASAAATAQSTHIVEDSIFETITQQLCYALHNERALLMGL